MTESLGAPDTKMLFFWFPVAWLFIGNASKDPSKLKEIIYAKCYANTSFLVVNINSNSYGNDLAVEQVISDTHCIKNLNFKLFISRG